MSRTGPWPGSFRPSWSSPVVAEATRLAAGAQEPVDTLLEHQAGQATGPAGAGVDADPVGAHDRLGFDRVTVHDDASQIAPGTQERLADPQEIVDRLLIERHRRIDPGVHEQVIAALEAELEPLQELHVAARNALAQMALQLLVEAKVVLGHAELHAVAVNRGVSAIAQPDRPDRGID